jgi:hypothetical protein
MAHAIFRIGMMRKFNEIGSFRLNSSYWRKIRNRILKQWQKEKELLTASAAKLKPESKARDGFYSKWIAENRHIDENLKLKKNRYFLLIGKILQDHRITPKNLDAYITKIQLPFRYGSTGSFVLLKVPYDVIQQELGISKEEVDKYLRAMQRHCGIIRKYKRDGENGPWIYAIGIWREVCTKKGRWLKPIYFLKKSDGMIQKLRIVDVYQFR